MVDESSYYVPSVQSYSRDIELEEVQEMLSENGIETEINDRPRVIEYDGDRMKYVFWAESVLQRDYTEGSMSEEDLAVLETAQQLTDNNLKMPETANPCP